MSENPALFREHIDIRFANVLFKMWKLQAKNAIALIIAPPSGVQVQFLVWKNCVLFYLYHINFQALSMIVWLKLMFVVSLLISHAHIDQP